MQNIEKNNNSVLIGVVLILLTIVLIFTGLIASGYIKINDKTEVNQEEAVTPLTDETDNNSEDSSNNGYQEVIIKRTLDINRDPVNDTNEGGSTELDYQTTVETK